MTSQRHSLWEQRVSSLAPVLPQQKEGDASDRYKQSYIDAKEEDVVLINSPCGLPGRAINSPMVKRYIAGIQERMPCRPPA